MGNLLKLETNQLNLKANIFLVQSKQQTTLTNNIQLSSTIKVLKKAEKLQTTSGKTTWRILTIILLMKPKKPLRKVKHPKPQVLTKYPIFISNISGKKEQPILPRFLTSPLSSAKFQLFGNPPLLSLSLNLAKILQTPNPSAQYQSSAPPSRSLSALFSQSQTTIYKFQYISMVFAKTTLPSQLCMISIKMCAKVSIRTCLLIELYSYRQTYPKPLTWSIMISSLKGLMTLTCLHT